MTPLISCIMPVADREDFMVGALACFAAQDYPNRELVVIDNGVRECRRLCEVVPGLRYFRVEPGRYMIGGLRNLACSRAEGDIIAHWDSDDWYSPDRLSAQYRALVESGQRATGYHEMVFADDEKRRAWLYRHSPGYAVGTSLMYWRDWWAAHPFPTNQPWGEDNAMVGTLRGVLASTTGADIVARIHGLGTSPRDITGWPEINYDNLGGIGYPVEEQ